MCDVGRGWLVGQVLVSGVTGVHWIHGLDQDLRLVPSVDSTDILFPSGGFGGLELMVVSISRGMEA